MNNPAKTPDLQPLAPPQARIENVTDDYHGHQITDPYRWLEDSALAETQKFVAEENAYTSAILEKIPGRDELRRRIERLLTIGRVSAPRSRGNRYFYERRDGRQNQSVVYVRDVPESASRDGENHAGKNS